MIQLLVEEHYPNVKLCRPFWEGRIVQILFEMTPNVEFCMPMETSRASDSAEDQFYPNVKLCMPVGRSRSLDSDGNRRANIERVVC